MSNSPESQFFQPPEIPSPSLVFGERVFTNLNRPVELEPTEAEKRLGHLYHLPETLEAKILRLESELTSVKKQHNDEIEKLNQQHNGEIEKLEKQHKSKINSKNREIRNTVSVQASRDGGVAGRLVFIG